MNHLHSKRFIALTVVLVGLTGCGKTSPAVEEMKETTDSHRPESVAAAAVKLKEIRDSIKAAFEAGQPNECDRALHEGADIVTVLAEVAGDEGFSSEKMETVKTASKQLMESFTKIHHGFHGHGGGDVADTEENAYESVAEAINAAIESLASVTDE